MPDELANRKQKFTYTEEAVGTKRQKRMGIHDYAVVYFAQSLPPGVQPPKDWMDMVGRFGSLDFRTQLNAAWVAAEELFGQDDSLLCDVKLLILDEKKIAERLNLTHEEKIELIRPIREKREERDDARWERNQMKWEAEREERIAAAVTEAMDISEEDRSWARLLRIKLD